MGIGPAGGAGVLHTSGKAMLMPPLPLWAMPRELTKVVCPIMSTSQVQTGHALRLNQVPALIKHRAPRFSCSDEQ